MYNRYGTYNKPKNYVKPSYKENYFKTREFYYVLLFWSIIGSTIFLIKHFVE